MIYSLDTDVKVLSVVFSSLFSDTKLIINSQKINHTYFYPGKLVEFMEVGFAGGQRENYREATYLHAKSLLTTYIAFGVDQNPGFHQVSHSLGLETWEEMSRNKILRTEDDYLELILNTYERREPLLSKLFFTQEEARSAGISGWHTQVRSVIKARRAVENETVPLLTVLQYQIKRAFHLADTWINPDSEADPLESGWELSEGIFSPILQDKTDEKYIIPNEILKGCSCKKKCSDSRRCGCYKSPYRSGCSPITCKNCSCHSVNLQLDHLTIHDVGKRTGDTSTEMEVDSDIDQEEEDEEDEEEDEEEEEEDESDWETNDMDDLDILPVDILD